MNDKSASEVASTEGLGPLLPCPLCGASKGYTLAEGTTYRWWYVSCAACGDEVGECAADRGHRNEPLPTRWRHADDHWNRVGAHAQSLRAALQEVDTIMGHDDAETEWREKWAGLWPNVEFSGVPAGHSSNHPAGGTSAGTQG